MFNLFGWGRRPASRSPTPESAFIRQGPTPPTTEQRRKHHLSHRVAIDSAGAVAIGLLSTGGVLIKHVNAVDLDYLGVSRRTSTPRPNPNVALEEDEWCAKLRSLGPRWYRSIDDWDISGERLETKAERQQMYVGYPNSPASGRILVMRCTRESKPEEWGAYNLCHTMQERCEVMERFGAIAYETADEVDELNGRHEQRMESERQELEDKFGSFPF